ncbi:CD276 antigen-like [Poecilia reticulata]|uniref:CD276 antigen-like n=1 Tax=Poecilia reticulata TaxID=8081 RepID=UPI0004A43618|nr:PREDICTED: CD276 antigen-like [Poecilia reticulata]
MRVECANNGRVSLFPTEKPVAVGAVPRSLYALLCAREGAMPATPWRGAALLLYCVCLCAALEPRDCILGEVGEPVLLPCHPNFGRLLNFSVEWRNHDKAVFRSLWDGDGNVETWSVNYARIPTDAATSGNFSLELPSAQPKHDRSRYSLFLLSGENQSAPACTRCLRVAASFRIPEVRKEEGTEWSYLCRSYGGYPEPAVYWLINDGRQPPNGSVRTWAQALPDSHLYNVTSQLTVNVSKDDTVSCTIKNPSTNETLTVKLGASSSGSRASQGMWIFSTVLCVVVAIMVLSGIYYQIHLDKISKMRKKEYEEPRRGRRYQYKQATEGMMPEPKETDV